jgi:hypothetical protein
MFKSGIRFHDGTYVTIGCGFSNNKNYKRKIWDYKRADYILMKQKISETDWDSVSTDFTLRKVLRKRSRIRISLLKAESSQTLSSFLIITSLVGMHILAIFKNIDVKSETAP